jgi:hypothetical protein
MGSDELMENFGMLLWVWSNVNWFLRFDHAAHESSSFFKGFNNLSRFSISCSDCTSTCAILDLLNVSIATAYMTWIKLFRWWKRERNEEVNWWEINISDQWRWRRCKLHSHTHTIYVLWMMMFSFLSCWYYMRGRKARWLDKLRKWRLNLL